MVDSGQDRRVSAGIGTWADAWVGGGHVPSSAVHDRAVFDKSPNHPASPVRQLAIEATYPF
jgi:hypothetical protein